MRPLIQSAPDEVWAAAEINHAPGQTFVHGHIRFTRERVPGVEARAISANARFIPERQSKRLAQREPAVFHRMMRIDLKVPFATEA